MENLQELTTIVSRIKTRRIEIIGKERTVYGKQTKKLYDGMVAGKYNSEHEAAIDIYGPDYKPNNFTRLKIILTEKLINTLFFIDISDYNFSNFQKAYIECEKLRTAIKILLSRTARGAAIKISEKLIQKSMKYEFTDITLEVARVLRRHYRTHDINAAKEKLYHGIVIKYFRILEAEIEVENCFELIIKETANSKGAKTEVIRAISKYEEKISAFFPKYESYKLGQFAHMATIRKYEYLKDYQSISTACKAAINYFESKKELFSKVISYKFYLRQIAVSVPLKEFEKGEIIAKKTLVYFDEGCLNWFMAMDSYFLLSLHTGNYAKAVDIFRKATQNKRFRNLTNDYKEMWRVYEAYLEYLRKVGELGTEQNKKSFRIGKFMNEVPIFSKDKKGVNVAIIIVQVLFLIAQGKEVKVIDKMEALRMYVHTHLRQDDSLRSNCFIKMLLNMVKSNFHKNGTIRRTKDLHEKLINTPIAEKSHSQYVEIIPYENLWKISLSQLSNRAF